MKEAHAKLIQKTNKTTLSNLTPLQATALSALRANKNLIIKPMDKNLELALMDLYKYIQVHPASTTGTSND
jgi:hypothetical protein